jgi:DNA ligase-1
LDLWLDARRRQDGPARVVVSHGHSDHARPHRELFLSAPTARFLRARHEGERVEHVLRFGATASFPGPTVPWRVTLLPAGHVLGSAMAFVEAGGQSLLYTGDFKLRPGLTAEPCAPRQADILVMETTFGRTNYRFPPASQVWQEIIQFCHQAIARREIPVLLGYALGKSQELLRGLAQAGLPAMAHPQVHEMALLYREFGVDLGPYTLFDPTRAAGQVLVFPAHTAQLGLASRLGPVRSAICTGWAVHSSCRYRHGTDAAFALSDHADFDELLEMVRRVAPRKVFTLHGFASEFAQALRDRGWDAVALSEPDQLGLALFPQES